MNANPGRSTAVFNRPKNYKGPIRSVLPGPLPVDLVDHQPLNLWWVDDDGRVAPHGGIVGSFIGPHARPVAELPAALHDALGPVHLRSGQPVPRAVIPRNMAFAPVVVDSPIKRCAGRQFLLSGVITQRGPR